jgi:lipid II isoglutaminyl synthase (glutamine-hydrolysing)
MPASRPGREYPVIRIAHLYPSLLNVAGDGGNVVAIERRAEWREIRTEIVPVEVGQNPDLATFDLVFIQGGQDVEMAIAADDLRAKAGSLRQAVDAGVVIFAVCAGLQLLGHRYIPQAGPAMEGLGLLDLETRAGGRRFMQHAACEVSFDEQPQTIVGFENHSGLTELGPGARPFGKVIAGAGNNGVDGTEGALQDTIYATYLHGPVLPRNPWLTDYLIRTVLERRVGGRIHLADLDDVLEERSHADALRRALQNRGRRNAIEPAGLGRTLPIGPDAAPPGR